MLLTQSQLYCDFLERTPTSRKLAEQAVECFPSGLTHDARYLDPYAIYIERAEGSRKWDVDGNEYVDYFGGHGALLLGHGHPQVVEAVRHQMTRGTHFGSSHELELRWARLVQELFPAAERIRFTSSGTEATMLAFRLARAFTGKPRILRFATHFHGWHDHVAFGVGSHHDGSATPGVLEHLARNVVLCPPGDLQAVRAAIAEHDDFAAVILEPTGASWGQIPLTESFLHALREVTAEHEILLIFDEVVSGFRCSPGGAQGSFHIQPDLTTLAKILAGGLPGGAVAGRREILDWLDHSASAAADREKITHQGTYNANPLSAAAGIAALTLVRDSDACQRACDYAEALREALRGVIRDEGLDWCIYGTFSGFHIFTNPTHDSVTAEQIEAAEYPFQKIKAAASSTAGQKIRIGMLSQGVDLPGWPGGPTSAVHTEDDLRQTVAAFRHTVRVIRDEGVE